MENQNMENNQGQQQGVNSNQQQSNQGQNNQQSEKLFTQDDVNRIVQERLARYKGNSNTNGNSDGFSERERNLDIRERKLEATERLIEAGISKDLLKLVNLNSKNEMEESIKILTEHFGMRKAQRTYRVSTGLSDKGSGGSGHGLSEEANIRKAMGLKG